jgi:hypothetical protein
MDDDSPPDDAWFADPRLARPTPMTVTDDGRVFGHLALWETEHIGEPGRTPPGPGSAGGRYDYFHTGAVRVTSGALVPTGQLTLSGGHAWPLEGDPLTAAVYYDRTASGVADIAVGEDRWGIWVAGALRTGVSAEQLRVLRASAPSGDWRPIGQRLELVGVCSVNVPGFPVPRVPVPVYRPAALAASGWAPSTAVLDRLTRLEHAVAALSG